MGVANGMKVVIEGAALSLITAVIGVVLLLMFPLALLAIALEPELISNKLLWLPFTWPYWFIATVILDFIEDSISKKESDGRGNSN